MGGKPCVKGTRIPVCMVLKALTDQILKDFEKVYEAYPQLTPQDVRAALDFAADWLEEEEVDFGSEQSSEAALRLSSTNAPITER